MTNVYLTHWPHDSPFFLLIITLISRVSGSSHHIYGRWEFQSAELNLPLTWSRQQTPHPCI